VSGGLRRIFVVFKTHFDLGFTGLAGEVLKSYTQRMIPSALDACRRTSRRGPAHAFTWTLPAWPLSYALKALQGTAAGGELERRTAEGKIAWHALPFTTHTELFGLEDLVRGLYVGRALRERFGRAPIAAKMTDVPGHTWILPTLLAEAGVKFLHLGCNACSTPPDVPFLFRWQGPDGSRLLTMYSRGGYGTTLFPPPGWNLPIWLALQHTSDNAGPQQAGVVDEILHAAAERFPGAEVVVGALDDFARELVDLDPELPVVSSDLADSWIHGIGSMPAEVSRLRGLRNRLVSAESALTIRSIVSPSRAGVPAGARAEIERAYRKILVFGEHTWGMDTKLALNPPQFGGRVYGKAPFLETLRSGRYDRIRRSWEDKSRLIADADDQVRRVESRLGSADGDGSTFEVVNHHLWRWNGWTEIGRFERAVTIAREADGGEVPLVRRNGVVWGDLRGLPPLSLTRLIVKTTDPVRSRGIRHGPGRKTVVSSPRGRIVLDNGKIRIDVDRTRAGIIAVVDKDTGRNWADAGRGTPFGAYRYDVFSRKEIVAYLKSYADDLEPWFLDDFGKPGYPHSEHRTFSGRLAGTEVESEPGWAQVRLTWRQDEESVREFGNAPETVQTIDLFDDVPWVEISLKLSAKDPCPLLEAGHAVFPFAARHPRYALNKTGSVIDPGADIARNANRVLFCCERWIDVEDGGQGILIVPHDSPLFSIGSMAIERFDGSALPGPPVLFFNLFNTQWGTNFPQWIAGALEYRFRFIPHKGNWRSARAWEHAAAAVQPPACRPAGANAPFAALLKSPAHGLEMVTLKPAEKGAGCILRLREPTGRGGSRRLVFKLPASAATPRVVRCSLLEDEREVLPTVRTGDSLSLALAVRSFEVMTLKVTP
jgi:alpha-mannosidase